jgi:hypothetical protein
MVLSTVVSDNISHLVLLKALVSSGVVVSGGDVVSADKSENKAVMVFEQRTVKGKMDEPFLFSEGDLAVHISWKSVLMAKPIKRYLTKLIMCQHPNKFAHNRQQAGWTSTSCAFSSLWQRR